ncbi:MAG: peptide chain release factor N(5)-glutamine methyltransferase [Eubacterium sp.]|nr:peptide chain release factor N(5)-glutamine methyltransferase [Eubacterium sp.]
MKNTIKALLEEGSRRLKDQGVPSARLDAEILLGAAAGLDRVLMYTEPSREISGDQVQRYEAWIARRCDFEPVAYILGHKEFMGLDFVVSPAVLIPRPDTECLVEYLLAQVLPKIQEPGAPVKILDLCTGSGAIGLSLAHYFKDSQVSLSDISAEALAVARENAVRLGLEDITFFEGDLFAPVQGSFGLVVSNPPYIPNQVIEGLSRDIKDHEPRLALSGGDSGFDIYGRIAGEAQAYLEAAGFLMLEIGDGQEKALVPMLEAQGFELTALVPDLTGTIRGVLVQNRILAG